MDALKGIEKILQENAFEQKKKKPRLKFNPRFNSTNGPSNNWALGVCYTFVLESGYLFEAGHSLNFHHKKFILPKKKILKNNNNMVFYLFIFLKF